MRPSIIVYSLSMTKGSFSSERSLALRDRRAVRGAAGRACPADPRSERATSPARPVQADSEAAYVGLAGVRGNKPGLYALAMLWVALGNLLLGKSVSAAPACSTRLDDGVCSVGHVQVKEGSADLGFAVGLSHVKTRCRERDKNGGDCPIRVEVDCL